MDIEKMIWETLRNNGLTSAGTAGLMGNLYAESGLIPDRVEILCLTRLSQNGKKYNDKTYTDAIDSGKIGKDEFLHPLPGKQYGYGLAQWTSPGRKSGLYDLAKNKKLSIGDAQMQISYLLQELKSSYKSVYNVLCATQSVKEASDVVLTKFECPADCGANVKATRASYGQRYYNKYKNIAITNESENKNMGTISVNDALNVMRGWIGMSRSKGTHKPIIDLYNRHKPLARGYKVSYSDAYCATTISAVFIKLNATDMVGGTECGVEEYIKLFKNKGIWNEDGTIVPEPGYIICYNWDDSTQPNDGYADHIGMVESVNKTNRTITIIEGNLNGNVARRTITVGWGYIRGYAIPKYKTENAIDNTANDTTKGECEVKLERITNGSKGNQVKTVQRILRELGYKGKDGKKLSVDGNCGDNTMYAVAVFQKAVGVKVTTGYGKAVSDKTWKALLNAA